MSHPQVEAFNLDSGLTQPQLSPIAAATIVTRLKIQWKSGWREWNLTLNDKRERDHVKMLLVWAFYTHLRGILPDNPVLQRRSRLCLTHAHDTCALRKVSEKSVLFTLLQGLKNSNVGGGIQLWTAYRHTNIYVRVLFSEFAQNRVTRLLYWYWNQIKWTNKQREKISVITVLATSHFVTVKKRGGIFGLVWTASQNSILTHPDWNHFLFCHKTHEIRFLQHGLKL